MPVYCKLAQSSQALPGLPQALALVLTTPSSEHFQVQSPSRSTFACCCCNPALHEPPQAPELSGGYYSLAQPARTYSGSCKHLQMLGPNPAWPSPKSSPHVCHQLLQSCPAWAVPSLVGARWKLQLSNRDSKVALPGPSSAPDLVCAGKCFNTAWPG